MFLSRMQRTATCCKSKTLLSYDILFSPKATGPQLLAKYRHHELRNFSLQFLPSSTFPSSQAVLLSHKEKSSTHYPLLSQDLIRYYSASPNPKSNDQTTEQAKQKAKDLQSTANQDQQGITGEGEEDEEKPKGILARFKDAYKNYGKALIGVHLATSSVWFGTFFYAAYAGLDIVPLLKWIGFSDRIISPFESSGVGNIAVAYLLYKIATPARYTVTIVGTQYTVRYLRQLGYMPPVPEGSRIRDLVKESREQVKGKFEDLKDDMKDKQVEYKEKYDDKIEEYKEKLEETKDKVKDKLKK